MQPPLPAALYLFLVTVSDAQGLSYYSDPSIIQRLSTDGDTLLKARQKIAPGQTPIHRTDFLKDNGGLIMIDYEDFCKIKNLHKEGLNPSQIAKKLALDSRTVCNWLHEKQFHPKKSSPRASKLDPFKNDIFRILEAHPYSAVQVYQRLRESGFEGGYTIVKEYARKIRPRRKPAFLKLHFAPGECEQVDWGSYGSVNPT